MPGVSLSACLVAFTVMTLAFMLTRLSGDLAISIAGPQATQADVEIVRKAYGLDRPLYVQFFSWVGRAMVGDFGQSYFFKDSVANLIARRMPITLTLGLVGLSLALIISIPLGILAAVRENTWIDRGVTMFTMVGQAMPSFWLALILMIVLGLNLGVLPISGTGTWQHFVMPGIVLAFTAIPALTRLTRSGMIEAMASDYIRTARAKGLSRARIIFKHALRNAAIPVVSIAAVQLGFMLGGSIVIETVFALHGVGYLGWESIAKNDFPVVQAVVLVLAAIYIGLTLAGRHPQCAARSEAADRMSEPIAIHAAADRRASGWRASRSASRSSRLIVAAALVGNALRAAGPVRPGSRQAPRAAVLDGGQPARTSARHRSARPRLSGAAGLWRAHLAADRHHDGDHVGPDRHHARRARRLLRRPRRRRGAVRHHDAVVDPGGAGRARGGRPDGVGPWARRRDARAAVVGPLRRGGARHHHAGAQRSTTSAPPGAPAPRRRICSIKEILPNIASHLAVVATLEMALAILLEAALSFLGLGVPPPLPSWGLMIAEGKDYMFFSPWVIMIPGVALFVLVLGINLVGDGLRNLLGTERLR